MSEERVRFLSREEILTLQEIGINEFGGSHGVRDQGLLDSAIAMPKQATGGEWLHAFPFGMAAAYAFHLSQNHPFIDGNKRAAFAATTMFLWLNEWMLEAAETDATDLMVRIANGKLNKTQIASWLEAHCRQR